MNQSLLRQASASAVLKADLVHRSKVFVSKWEVEEFMSEFEWIVFGKYHGHRFVPLSILRVTGNELKLIVLLAAFFLGRCH